MADKPDIIEQIPDPETIRNMLAESIRRSELLRSLLRVAKRKATIDGQRAASTNREVEPCHA